MAVSAVSVYTRCSCHSWPGPNWPGPDLLLPVLALFARSAVQFCMLHVARCRCRCRLRRWLQESSQARQTCLATWPICMCRTRRERERGEREGEREIRGVLVTRIRYHKCDKRPMRRRIFYWFKCHKRRSGQEARFGHKIAQFMPESGTELRVWEKRLGLSRLSTCHNCRQSSCGAVDRLVSKL